MQLVELLPDTERESARKSLLGPRTRWPAFRHRDDQSRWNDLVNEYSRLRSIDEPGYIALLQASERRYRIP
jgi:hypothetical protein